MSDQKFSFEPPSTAEVPRFAGIPTFMRLPHVSVDDPRMREVDVGLIGVPWDGGTTNRAGARHGPRQMRDMSTLMRNVHPTFLINPYELANAADLGDTPVNPLSIDTTLQQIEDFYTRALDHDIVPLSAGGDHLVSLPILRALTKKTGSVGMVHFDAHTDTFDRYFGGYKYTHGTPFRRAIEEGILDPKRTIQIGIRGGIYTRSDYQWGLDQGIRVVFIEEYNELGVQGVIEEIQRVVGPDLPTYVSFDVDFLDPVYAPGTGTPEIGGVSSGDAQVLLRSLRNLNLVGGDVVEVAPPFDPSGNTALVAATMMWEILCMLCEQTGARRS